jgi:protein-S-isoprenylcysteine O-methyltransferase Ste14
MMTETTARAACVPRSTWQDRAARAGVALWFLGLSALMLRQIWIALRRPLDAAATTSLMSLSCAFLFLATILCIILLRPPPSAKAPGWRPRIAALLGSYLLYGLVLLPRGEVGIAIHLVSSALIVCGNALAFLVLLNLGRSFSIMAEARQLVTNGPYSIVRHPLYLAEQIGMLGLFVEVASWEALVVVAAQIYFQLQRMRNEEAILSASFPEYAAYAGRTARLIPSVW